MNEINIYCDESNHLENSPINIMTLGAVYCEKDKTREINTRIRELKKRHHLAYNFEAKWTKISPSSKSLRLQFYQDLIDYFFDNTDLHFRGIVIDKKQLDHKKFNQTHDKWYYKMYFELLSKLLDPSQKYYIYIDIKDTQGNEKVQKLHDVLSNDIYDFEKNIIKNVQQVRSHEIEILQITDLLIGALQFANRDDGKSVAKKSIVEKMRKRSGYSLLKSTLFKETKLNVFHWKGLNSNF